MLLIIFNRWALSALALLAHLAQLWPDTSCVAPSVVISIRPYFSRLALLAKNRKRWAKGQNYYRACLKTAILASEKSKTLSYIRDD